MEIQDEYEDSRDESQRRRAKHRKTSPILLEKNGVNFKSKNNGVHLVVECADWVVDF